MITGLRGASIWSEDLMADWKRLKGAGVEFVEHPTNYGNVRR